MQFAASKHKALVYYHCCRIYHAAFLDVVQKCCTVALLHEGTCSECAGHIQHACLPQLMQLHTPLHVHASAQINGVLMQEFRHITYNNCSVVPRTPLTRHVDWSMLLSCTSHASQQTAYTITTNCHKLTKCGAAHTSMPGFAWYIHSKHCGHTCHVCIPCKSMGWGTCTLLDAMLSMSI